LKLIYSVKENGFGPKTVSVNGMSAAFGIEENKYRRGGVVIPTAQFLKMLDRPNNTIEILI